jgi:transcriptional regulator with XRE-family HTH domain
MGYKVKMLLSEWLKREKIGVEEFGKRIGRSHATVSRWCTGKRTPSFDALQKIMKATNGEVTAEDFFRSSAAA